MSSGSSISLQNTLDKLQGVKKSRDGWLALCPAHEDRHQSLSVSEGRDGRALLYCHAGCRLEDILRGLGLKKVDLFPAQDKTSAKLEIVDEYNYVDEDGKLLYQVCRTFPKGFFQRRPSGRDGWIKGLNNVRRVIYRLPQVLDAVKSGKDVYICEGEKDADKMVSLGLTATTCPMGAGKWKEEYGSYFNKGKVVILPDNDEPGIRHAIQVAKSLHGKVSSLKILKLPNLQDKGDVSDWLGSGGTVEELMRLTKEAEEWKQEAKKPKRKPEIVCLADVEPSEVYWLWKPYLPRGKLTLLEGDPGVGKTWLSLKLASATSCGAPFPDAADGIIRGVRVPENVLYLSAEDGLSDTLRPRLEKLGADLSKVYVLDSLINEDGERAGVTLSDIDVLEQTLQQVRPALVVVDPIQGYLGAGVDFYRANEVRPILSGLATLAEHYGCAVICVRHLSKSTQGRALYRGMGSIDFAAAARSIILAGADPDNPEKRGIIHVKSSLEKAGLSIGYRLQDGVFDWTGVSDLTTATLSKPDRSEDEKDALTEAKEFLQEYLRNEERTMKDVLSEAKGLGIAERTLKRAKSQLGVLSQKTTGQGKNSPWLWKLPSNSPEHSEYHSGTI